MEYRKVTAIILDERLEDVEKALIKMRVPGVSVSQVRGYGKYHNFYEKDMMCRHARLEIFCPASEAEAIAQCIIDTAHVGMSSDGMIAILPVEKLYRIRTSSELCADDAD